ncbi:MAG: hypothetical protein ABIH87_04810 [bacterium]
MSNFAETKPMAIETEPESKARYFVNTIFDLDYNDLIDVYEEAIDSEADLNRKQLLELVIHFKAEDGEIDERYALQYLEKRLVHQEAEKMEQGEVFTRE